jgi:hypothetical protein
MAGVITSSCQSVWLHNGHSLAWHWQTHLPDAMADNISRLNQAHVQYQNGTGGSTVEKPAETLKLTAIRAPNSRSGGHKFKSTTWRELTKKWKDPWGQVFLQRQ